MLAIPPQLRQTAQHPQRESGTLYLVYLWEVIKRAFTATPRMTDALQILAASALPAISTAFGVKLPDEAPSLVLAYIGMATVAFFVIRLFWAPYAIWKEQISDIGTLKLELSRPERMIMERLSRHRAKARSKLAGLLEDFQSLAFADEWTDWCIEQTATRMSAIRRLEATAGLPQQYMNLRGRLLVVVQKEGALSNDDLPLARHSDAILKLLQAFLVGNITAESLALQSPPYIALETQP